MTATRLANALLVDDDPEAQPVNQQKLEDDGYSVVLVRDEVAGLARAKQMAPDVIFVHLVSKASGNLPFIQALRADDSCRHVRVVVLRNKPGAGLPNGKLRNVPRDGG